MTPAHDLATESAVAAGLLGRYGVCDHCLGRLFARRLGLSSYTRLGRRLRREADGARHAPKNTYDAGRAGGNGSGRLGVGSRAHGYGSGPDERTGKKCYICRGLCDRIPELARLAVSASEGYEFGTFSVGSVVKPSILDRDDRVRSAYRLQGADSVKTGLTREVARRFAKATCSAHERDAPEISVTVQPAECYCEVRPKPVAVYGRYTKHTRGIPQKQDRCKSCLGRGCYACELHGISGHGSVEGQISAFLFGVLGGTTAGFTWVGGEDKGSLVRGRGRPFFARIQRPRRRHIQQEEDGQGIRLGGIALHGLRDVALSGVGPVKFSSRAVIHVVMRSETTSEASDVDSGGAGDGGGDNDNAGAGNAGAGNAGANNGAGNNNASLRRPGNRRGSGRDGPHSAASQSASAPALQDRTAPIAPLQDTTRPGFLRALKRLANTQVSVLSKNGRYAEKTIRSLAYRRNAADSFVIRADLDGGVPIKRLVTGEGVSPSVSDVLGVSCECVRFDFENVWTEREPRRAL